ncbi:MAG TPA: CPBP family glutamic-type intramembrane protease [Methylomirabilota bacterium]|nr:CPBP family glutamic-type intramembrane protease [Methylomirabilota bacterium]
MATNPIAVPLTLRRWTVVELGILGALTALYLRLWPYRPPGVDPSLALVGVGLVWLFARPDGIRLGAALGPAMERLRAGAVTMAWFTLPVVLAFGVFGGWQAYAVHHDWAAIGHRLFTPRFFVTLALYLPWALVQQTLFQCYLLGRLRRLAPAASPLALAALNGLFYGAVHLPDWEIALVTIAGGVVWTYAYQRHRSVLPIAVSHAVLGSTYFYWVRHRHVVRIFWLALAGDLSASS